MSWESALIRYVSHFNFTYRQALVIRRASFRNVPYLLTLCCSHVQVPLDKLHYLTRIHYLAPSDGGVWGEHEIDYIVFAQLPVSLDLNLNEVQTAKYITQSELKQMFKTAGMYFLLHFRGFIFPASP